tara:strand:- start:460 stop:1392 length:933 start_codon:yes stop_codon:yes gene_type:complete
MRGGFFFSLVFHAVVGIFAYLGMPYMKPEPLITEPVIFVEVVDVAEESNAPPPQSEPEPEEINKPEPPPQKASTPPPEPVPEPGPEPKPAPELEPVVELKPEPKAKPKPKPKPKPTAKPKPKPVLADIHPPKKPKPPDAFASVLKTLTAMQKDKLKPKEKKEKEKKKKKKKEKTDQKSTFEKSIAAALKSTSQKRHNPSLPVSMSETDAIRKHFQRCWNVPAGAKDAEGMVVELEIRFQQDGAVRSVQVLDSVRMRRDPFFRTSAEAAQRAVLHPKCNKLSMPADQFPDWQTKYQKWQKMTLVFDPRDMF